MAVISYNYIRVNPYVIVVEWLALTETNSTGQPVEIPQGADKTVQVEGTFGTGGVVTLEGSNQPIDAATVVYDTLHDPQGSDIAIGTSSQHMEAVLENPRIVRPTISAGTGVTLNCRLAFTGDKPI